MIQDISILNRLITPDNWTFCQFKQGNQKAQITFGATPASDDLIYFVSVLDKEDRDLFQKEFLKIEAACHFLNSNYHDWDFVNQLSQSADGCSSCSAH